MDRSNHRRLKVLERVGTSSDLMSVNELKFKYIGFSTLADLMEPGKNQYFLYLSMDFKLEPTTTFFLSVDRSQTKYINPFSLKL